MSAEPVKTSQNVAPSLQAPLEERVQEFIAARQGALVEVVCKWLEEDGYTGIDKERPLASNLICGHMALATQIGALLSDLDCHVYKVRLPVKSPYQLKEVLSYGACLHKVPVISDSNERVIADGAYLQFLKSVTDSLPVEDFLIRKVEDVQDTANRFAALNDVSAFSGFIRLMPDQGPGNRKVDCPTVDLEIGEHSLSDYLKRLWNVGSSQFYLEETSSLVRSAVFRGGLDTLGKGSEKLERYVEDVAAHL
jgi:hypothetical protein